MLLKDLGEMFVRRTTHAFSFEGDEDGLARVGVEEIIAHFQDRLEILWSGETDWEGTVDEVKVPLAAVDCVNRL